MPTLKEKSAEVLTLGQAAHAAQAAWGTAQAELRKLEEQDRQERGNAILALLEGPHGRAALAAFVPEHTRTTCNDVNPVSSDGTCTRCTLLQAMKDRYWDDRYEVVVEIKTP